MGSNEARTGEDSGSARPGHTTREVVAAVTVVLALLTLLFLARALPPGKVLLPLDIVTQQWPPWQALGQVDAAHNPLLSDVVSYIYPVKEFAAAALRRGEYPLWNPFVLTGYPFTYNTQAGIFYPLSPLYLLFAPTTAVDLTIIAQMFLGGLFMALYLRQIGLRRLAVLGGGVLFLFNGLMVVWLEWQVVHAAIIWLPLALFFCERLAAALQKGDRRQASAWGLAAAMTLAVPWLGGHWNWTLYMTMTGAVYLGARLGALWWEGRGKRPPAVPLWPVLAVPALALAFSLVQVLPAVNYLARSHRTDLPFDQMLRLGLLNRGVALLVPRFFGDPITRTWWGADNFNETTLYAGILPLMLAFLAVLLRRDWYTKFFAAWGLLGLLWALGPLYGLLYVLPVFGGLQPSRAAILVVFCLTVLAALGLDRMLEPAAAGERRWGRQTAVFAALLIGVVVLYVLYYAPKVQETWPYLGPQIGWFLFWLAGSALLLWAWQGERLPRPWLGILAIFWLTADLFVFGYTYNPVRPVSELYPPTATTGFLQAHMPPSRMVTPPQGLAYPPNSSLVPRLSNLSGYEPGIPATLAAYVNAAEGGDAIRFERKLQPLAGLPSPLLDALSVRYVVTSADVWGEAVAAGPRANVAAWAALPQQTRLGGIAAGLQRIDVPLRGTGEATLRVLSADGGYEFAHATAVPDPAVADGWTSFFVDPFPAEWGGEFIFRVEGTGEAGLTPQGALAAAPTSLERPGLVFEDGKTRVYSREGAFARAYIVPQAQLAANVDEALEAVLAQQERLASLVVLETQGQEPPPGLAFAPGAAAVNVDGSALNRLQVSVELAEPGFLVLSDAWYPGWRATVDGEETAVYRANSVARAVFVPAGNHELVFTFQPLDFAVGAAVSTAAWTAALGFLFWYWLRRRREAVDV